MISEEDIPDGWDIKSMGNLCEYIQRGKQPQYDDEEGTVRVVNQRCIYWDGLHLENMRGLDDDVRAKWQDYRYLKHGDVLLNSLGKGTLGRAQVLDRDIEKPLVADGNVTVIRTGDEILPRYLFYYLMSPSGQSQIFKGETGATGQTNLPKYAIVDIKIPVPPREEQERIVSVLDAAFGATRRIDSLSEDVAEYTTEFANAMSHATLGPENIPDHWEITKIENVCEDSFNGGTPKRSNSDYWEGGIPWLSSGEIRNVGIYDADESITHTAISETSAKLFPQDSVLVAMYGSGTRGRSAVLRSQMSGNQAICCLIPDSDICSPEYLQTYLRGIKDKLSQKGRGGTQSNINKSIILDTQMPLPPQSEQSAIVSQVDTVYSTSEVVSNERGKVNNHKDELKDAMLAQAFTGQLVT